MSSGRGGTSSHPYRSRWRVRAVLWTVAALLAASCAAGNRDGAPAADRTGATSAASTNAASTTVPRVRGPVSDQPEVVPSPPSSVPASTPSGIAQPIQPVSGPGGSTLAHADWRESSGGQSADAWYVFEPSAPAPPSAPVAIVLHGYYEYSGYAQLHELIRHTVRTGSIVIYPRWQTDIATPCPGPFDVEPCVRSALAGITGALEFLRSDPSRVQPQLDRLDWFGLSFGGVLAANLASRSASLGLPAPGAIFLDDPHDGGLDGEDEPAVDRPLAGIESPAQLVCHVGAEGVIAEPGQRESSCNAIVPLLTRLPEDDTWLVMSRPDGHGEPPLSSGHGVCAAFSGGANAYDWNVCWRLWDALRAAVDRGTTLEDEVGGSAAFRDLGTWSDGTPLAGLEVRHTAPIGP